MRRARTPAKVLLVCLLLTLLVGYGVRHVVLRTPDRSGAAPAITPAAVPDTSSAEAIVAGAGIVEPSSELIALAPGRSGVVTTVAVAPGQEVHAGDLLLRLDDREQVQEIEARVAARRTAVANEALAAAELRTRRDALEIYQSLGDARFMVREKLLERSNAVLEAQARLDVARARVAEIDAGLQQARVQRDLLEIRSPIEGTVLQVRVRPGEFASASRAGEAPITVGKTHPLHVRIDIDEADVPRFVAGTEAMITARGGVAAPTTARFVRVEPLLIPKRSLTNAADERVDTRVMQVVFALPAGAQGFFVGQQVDAFVRTGREATAGRHSPQSVTVGGEGQREPGRSTHPMNATARRS